MRFYVTAGWLRVRLQVLERDKYACSKCRDAGKYTKANTVHHLRPLSEAPHMALDLGNLTSLCHACHEAIHSRVPLAGKQLAEMFPERW